MKNLLNKGISVRITPIYDWDEWELVEFEWEADKLDKFIEIEKRKEMRRKYDGRNYHSYPKQLKQADHIINNSEGKNANDIFNKVRPLVKKYTYSWSTQSPYQYFINNFHSLKYNQNGVLCLVNNYNNSWSKFEPKTPNRWRDTFYIDSNNIICKLPYKPTPPKRRNMRKRYEEIHQKRKEWKQKLYNREKQAELLLQLINFPELYNYYQKLLSEYNQLIEKQRMHILYSERFRDKSERRNLWWRWRYEMNKYDMERLRELKIKVGQIEAGNFKIFLKSKEYLYSKYKECHHMGPTPHKIYQPKMLLLNT